MSATTKARRRRLRQRTAALRQELGALDYVAAGTLSTRMTKCGRANCRCAIDPTARHGPYHEWTHREDGRLVNHRLNAEQAELMAQAIANYRHIQQLLARWQRETAAEILGLERGSDE